MKVSALSHRTVTSCTDRDTLEQAAALLWRHGIGCLPVLGDDGRLVGMLTDRDIAMAAFHQGAPLRSIAVSSVMARDIVACHDDDDVDSVVQLLIARRLRRIPVTDADHRVVGILSLNDIARAAIANELPAAGIPAVLAALSVPRPLSISTSTSTR
jgi:CBS domain-containing protein